MAFLSTFPFTGFAFEHMDQNLRGLFAAIRKGSVSEARILGPQQLSVFVCESARNDVVANAPASVFHLRISPYRKDCVRVSSLEREREARFSLFDLLARLESADIIAINENGVHRLDLLQAFSFEISLCDAWR